LETDMVVIPKGDWLYVYATGTNSDGSVIVGYGVKDEVSSTPIIWTQAGGIVALQEGVIGQASKVSADGAIVVGYYEVAGVNHAFRWDAVNGLADIHGLGTASEAKGVSADGNIVIGSVDSGVTQKSFIWTQSGGMVDMGAVPGSITISEGISGDGLTVVGRTLAPNYVAFKWTAADGFSVYSNNSSANATNYDGTVIVGNAAAEVFGSPYVFSDLAFVYEDGRSGSFSGVSDTGEVSILNSGEGVVRILSSGGKVIPSIAPVANTKYDFCQSTL